MKLVPVFISTALILSYKLLIDSCYVVAAAAAAVCYATAECARKPCQKEELRKL